MIFWKNSQKTQILPQRIGISGDRPAWVGEAVVQRQSDESFFNLIWHSLFVSIKQITIGRGAGKG